MTLTLRARFALLAGGAVVIVSTAVAVVGWAVLARSLDRQVRRDAAGQARQLAAIVDTGSGKEHGNGNFVDLSDPSLTGQLRRPGLWVAIVGPHGRVLRRSAGAPAGLAAPVIARCASRGSASALTQRAAVACRRAGTRGFVVAARPRIDAQRVLGTTERALAGAVAIGGLTSVALAWLLAGRALSPLRLIARTARSIREGELERRIAYRGRDELGAVAAELDRSFAELAGMLERQQRFVADASHHLKTPLAGARANVEILRRWAGEDPESRREALAALERSIARMTRIVADLLQLAAGSAPSTRREPLALDDVLLEAARDTHALGAPPPMIERLDRAVVLGDRARLLQLISNLIDNAVAASPEESPARLSLAADGERARVAVHDDGPGIASQDLPHVFERFYRGTGAASGAGAGLGLAIAREIARAHGGDVTVETAPGAGTTVSVELPLDPSSHPHAGVSHPSSAPSTVVSDKSKTEVDR